MTIIFLIIALSLASWHVARVIADGALFEPMRKTIFQAAYGHTPRNPVATFLASTLNCRLCFGTQVAIVFTTTAITVALLSGRMDLPIAELVLTYILGPFVIAGLAEIIRRIEYLEVPG